MDLHLSKENDNLMAKFRTQIKPIFLLCERVEKVKNLPKARQKPKATMMVSTVKEILERQFHEFRNWAMWFLYLGFTGLKSRGKPHRFQDRFKLKVKQTESLMTRFYEMNISGWNSRRLYPSRSLIYESPWTGRSNRR